MACDPRVKNVFPVTWLHDFSQSWHGLQESFDTPTQENTCGVPDNSNDEKGQIHSVRPLPRQILPQSL